MGFQQQVEQTIQAQLAGTKQKLKTNGSNNDQATSPSSVKRTRTTSGTISGGNNSSGTPISTPNRSFTPTGNKMDVSGTSPPSGKNIVNGQVTTSSGNSSGNGIQSASRSSSEN